MNLTTLLQEKKDISELRNLWLILPNDLYEAVMLKQQALGNSNNRVSGIQGPENKWIMCADLLSEISSGGLFTSLFTSLDFTKFAQVEVKTRAEVEQLGWFQ